jgi:phosphoribosylamine--glycine ligase
LTSDLVDLLEGDTPHWSDETTVNVVLAAKGYPEAPIAGDVIRGIDRVPDDVLVFHAGTRLDGKALMVDGGRVLNLVGIGPTLDVARARVYEAVASVRWPGSQFRTDIAADIAQS